LRLHIKAEAITPLEELSFSLKSLLISNTSQTKGVAPIVLLDQSSNNYSFGGVLILFVKFYSILE
jgi:hypothetical protein